MSDVIEIRLGRGKVAVIDAVDEELAQFNWRAMKARNSWYAIRFEEGVRGPTYLHREVARRAGIDVDSVKVDHRDLDGLNCRRLNLRVAS
jgi:hypothetical protein